MPLIDQNYLYYAFDYSFFHRAMYLHQAGAVRDFTWLFRDAERATFRGTVWDDRRTSCTVSVDVVRDRGVTASYCDNPKCRRTLRCAHVGALLMAYISEARKVEENERSVRSLLSAYMPAARRRTDANEAPVRLVPMLSMPIDRDDQPELSLKIGRSKLYIVKKPGDLVDRVANREEFSYGKQLTFVHELAAFDESSRDLLKLVTQAVNEYRHYAGDFESGYGYQHLPVLGESIRLAGRSLDEFFDLYKNKRVEERHGRSPIELTEEMPPLTMNVTRAENGEGTYISLADAQELFPLQTSSCHYLMSDDRIIRCPDRFGKRLLPLFHTLQNGPLYMDDHSMSSFCSCVLPAVQKDVIINDRQDIIASFLPDDCTPVFRLDLEDDTLRCTLRFRYGNSEYAPGEQGDYRRDAMQETQAEELLRNSFLPDFTPGLFVLRDEIEPAEFMLDGVPELQSVGEVYISDRLQNLEVRPSRPVMGVSVANGMLLMKLDTGGFPPEELEALYESMLRRRRYHRLADGRFFQLTGSAVESIAEVAHLTQASGRELSGGEITMPAFRAPYLENVLGEHEDMHIRRDSNYRDLIRRFRNVRDSEDIIPEGFDGVLRTYQENGFRWLKTIEKCGFGGILADEMGLGKTLQVISLIASAPRSVSGKPTLVVCPTSLVLNWQDEIKKFAPGLGFRAVIGTAAARREILQKAAEDPSVDVLITSYELLRRDIEEYAKLAFDRCVLDEGQMIKNQSTLASKAVKRINAAHRLVLTGTPVENRLSELWNLFDFLMPGYLFSHTRFVEKLEKPIVKSGDSEAQKQLNRMVQPFMLRRLKRDVLKELPPKMDYVRRIPLQEEERKVYLSAVNDLKKHIEKGSRMQILAGLTRLRQICCDPSLAFINYAGPTSKLDACVELVRSMVENGHQILLFSQFTTMLDAIRARLDSEGVSSYTLQGSTPKETRAQLVRDFNNGGASVFLISLKAGGTGLNLTAADVVIHYDPWWNMAAQNQATDRAHRIGQQKCVQVYRLIAEDTIEERILELQEKKAALMDSLSDDSGSSLLGMDPEELMELLE